MSRRRPSLVVWPGPTDRALDEDGLRVAQLARHELAVAFAGARLREALDRSGTSWRHRRRCDRPDRPGRRGGPGGAAEPGRRATARASAAAAVGRTCADVLGCEVAGSHAPTACPLAEVLPSGVPIAYRETAVRRRRWAAASGSPAATRRAPGGRDGPGDGDPARHQRGPGARGAPRRLRRDGQPRAADAAGPDPGLRGDTAPLRPRAGRAAGVRRAHRRGVPAVSHRSSTRSWTSRTSRPIR